MSDANFSILDYMDHVAAEVQRRNPDMHVDDVQVIASQTVLARNIFSLSKAVDNLRGKLDGEVLLR